MSTLSKPPRQRTELRQAHLVEAALTLAARCSPADITTTDLANAVGITQGAVFRHFANKEAIWLAVMDVVTTQLMSELQAAALSAGALPFSCTTASTACCELRADPTEPMDRTDPGDPTEPTEPAELTEPSEPTEPAEPIKPIEPAEPAEPTEATGINALRALEAVFMAHVRFVVAHPGVPRVIFQELQRPQDTALKASVRTLMQQYRALLMRLLRQAETEQLIAPKADLTGACVLFIGSVQGLVMQALMSGDVAAMTDLAPGVFAIYQRGLCASPAAERFGAAPFDPARRPLKAAL